MDSLGGVDNLPADLITQLQKLTTSSTIPYHLSPQVIPIDIPPQMGNDCGACVNHVAEALVTIGPQVLTNTASFEFDTVQMRVHQLKVIWDHVLLPCV